LKYLEVNLSEVVELYRNEDGANVMLIEFEKKIFLSTSY
jgi:hypothetical protein